MLENSCYFLKRKPHHIAVVVAISIQDGWFTHKCPNMWMCIWVISMEFIVLSAPKRFWRSLQEILFFSLSFLKPTKPLELIPLSFAFAWLNSFQAVRHSLSHHLSASHLPPPQPRSLRSVIDVVLVIFIVSAATTIFPPSPVIYLIIVCCPSSFPQL